MSVRFMVVNPVLSALSWRAQLLFAYWRLSSCSRDRNRTLSGGASAATAVLGKIFLESRLRTLSSRSILLFCSSASSWRAISFVFGFLRLPSSALRFFDFSIERILNSINLHSSSDRIVHFPSKDVSRKNDVQACVFPVIGPKSIISGVGFSFF